MRYECACAVPLKNLTVQQHFILLSCSISVRGTILVTIDSLVWNWGILRAWLMFFYCPKLFTPFLFSTVWSFSTFSMGWFCAAGVFELIRCLSLSPNFSFPPFFITIIIIIMIIIITISYIILSDEQERFCHSFIKLFYILHVSYSFNIWFWPI